MQCKLLSLAILPVASSSSLLHLRGGPISQASVTTSHNHGVSLLPPDNLCLAESRRSACEELQAKDGTGCVWCDVPSKDMEYTSEEGLCISQSDVSKAMELMSFPCPHFLPSKNNEDYQDMIEGDKEALQGNKKPTVNAATTQLDFSCFSQAWGGGDKELCGTSRAIDGSSCLWCVAADDLVEVGACLSTSQAVYASELGLICANYSSLTDEMSISLLKEKVNEGLPDFNCFKAAWIADNAEISCGQTTASDGSPCVWCRAHGDTMGACLSSVEAGFANGQFGLTCPISEIEEAKGGEFEDNVKSHEENFVREKEELIPS